MISSAILIFVSLLTLLMVGGWVIHSFTRQEFSPEQFLLDQYLFQVEDKLASLDGSGGDFDELGVLMAEYGYETLVIREESLVYHSEGFATMDPASPVKDIKWTDQVQVFCFGDITLAGVQKGDVLIAAYKITMNTNALNQFEKVLRQFLTMGVLTILVICVAGQIFTNYLAKRILKPITELSKGARRIEEGNLSVPVVYEGKDEFAEVCDAFNHMQTHLKEEQEKNTAYEKARIDLVAGISHDLRTPLTSIKGYVKGLRDGVANTPKKQEQYLSIAYQKACDMEVLLQQLFYFSGMETGNLPIFLESSDLGEFAVHFAHDYAREFEQKGGELIIRDIREKHPVMLDVIQMNRVLLNLTENALKYAKASPLKMTIDVWTEKDRECLKFADNGNGVTEEQLPCLFEQFWRADEARSSKNGEGSGLGLYIVRYIIEIHGGSITARNNNGLEILITLPRRTKEQKQDE